MTTTLNYIRWGLIAIVALMPLHAFLVVSLGHFIGGQELWQAWKEIVLLIAGALTAIYLWKNPAARSRLSDPLAYLIAGFAALALLVTAITRPAPLPMIMGLKIDLAMFVAFLIALLVSDLKFKTRLLKIFLWSSSIVIGFGLMLAYLLPRDFLVQFGYGPDTVPAYQLVDPVVDAVRIVSTLGGPNQLGAFLIIPICLVLNLMIRRFRWWQPLFILGGALVVWHSYSRSAWLGLAVAVTVTLILQLPRKFRLPLLLASTVVAALVLNLLIVGSTVTSKLQYYVFHHSVSDSGFIGSTDAHSQATKLGTELIQQNPLGMGLGTAGPASFYADKTIIPESWYLQLGIEVGLLGLLLFIIIQVVLAFRLMQANSIIKIAPGLIGALAGIACVNFFLHGWADSSTALCYWTLAGAALGAAAVTPKRVKA